MSNRLFRIIVIMQVLVIFSVFAFIAAGDQIILRLNPSQMELSAAKLGR